MRYIDATDRLDGGRDGARAVDNDPAGTVYTVARTSTETIVWRTWREARAYALAQVHVTRAPICVGAIYPDGNEDVAFFVEP